MGLPIPILHLGLSLHNNDTIDTCSISCQQPPSLIPSHLPWPQFSPLRRTGLRTRLMSHHATIDRDWHSLLVTLSEVTTINLPHICLYTMTSWIVSTGSMQKVLIATKILASFLLAWEQGFKDLYLPDDSCTPGPKNTNAAKLHPHLHTAFGC